MSTYQVKRVFGDSFLPNGTPTIFINGSQFYGTDAYSFPAIREWLSIGLSGEIIDQMVTPLENDPSLIEGPIHTKEEIAPMMPKLKTPMSESTQKFCEEILAKLRAPLK